MVTTPITTETTKIATRPIISEDTISSTPSTHSLDTSITPNSYSISPTSTSASTESTLNSGQTLDQPSAQNNSTIGKKFITSYSLNIQ